MIRSDKFINIKSEYPNYFLDTQKFIKELKDIIEKVKEGKTNKKTTALLWFIICFER